MYCYVPVLIVAIYLSCILNLMFVDPCIIVQFITKNPTRCNNVSKLYYSIIIWSSTCFGGHTAHHQEPKPALAASGFLYVEGCWTCSWWTLSGTYCAWQHPVGCGRPDPDQQHSYHHAPTVKPETATAVVELLMMGMRMPETCWAVNKRQVINLKNWCI
jgi:hypothetical protein